MRTRTGEPRAGLVPGVLLLLSGVFVIVVLALGASSSAFIPTAVDDGGTTQENPLAPPPPSATSPADDGSADTGRSPDELFLGDLAWYEWVGVVFIVALGIMFWTSPLFLLGLLRLPRRHHRDRVTTARRTQPDPTPLQEAVADAAVLMEQGSAREAVVGCWLLLVRAGRRAGTAADPAETSSEYGRRLARTHLVDEGAVVRLGQLYRQARFSEHAVDEGMRAQARQCLGRLQSDLAQGSLRVGSDPAVDRGPR